MMDVSDGLLIDAHRMAEASGVGAEIDLSAVPLGDAFVEAQGEELAARLFAATGGDDYALLAAGPQDLLGLCLPTGTTLTAIGQLVDGQGLSLRFEGRQVPVPEHLGHEHRPV